MRFLLLGFLILFAINCGIRNTGSKLFSETMPTYRIAFDAAKLQVTFSTEGHETFSKINFTVEGGKVNSAVEWWTNDAEIPTGLTMDTMEDGSALISGFPKFQHEWCFELTAAFEGESDWEEITEPICMTASVPRGSGYHWVPGEKRELHEYAPITVGEEYFGRFDEQMLVNLDEVWVAAGELPPGITAKIHPQFKKAYFEGTPTEAGYYVFALTTVRSKDSQQAARQFVMKVTE